MRIEETINDIVKKACNLFKGQYVALILGTLVAFVGMIFIITIPPLVFGIFLMCVKLVKGEKIEISDVFKGFNYFFRSWVLIVTCFFAILVGLVFLILPGLLLIVLFQYAVAIALLEDRGAISSIKRSYTLGKENFTFSLVFLILMMVLDGIGSYTRIGVLITTPFTMLCTVLAAQKLAAKSKTK